MPFVFKFHAGLFSIEMRPDPDRETLKIRYGNVNLTIPFGIING